MRHIVHMDLDSFFISCEKLINPALEGKPVIIGGKSDRGVVASCSYEARYYGVRSGMPMRMANRLCSDALILKGDMDLYSRKSKEVTQIVEENAPTYEKASIDEFYLDITGMDRFFGSYKWAQELNQTITKESGLPISFGLSTNKTVAKMATNYIKPQGKIEIPHDMVRPFLNPQSISKIPMLGQATYKLLSRVGIRKIQTLADMPIEPLQRMLGKNGISLHNKANGIDNSPVVQYSERKSMSTERTFDKDSMDITALKSLLVQMTEKLCFLLRNEGKLTACVAVKIRYSNFDTHTQQRRIPYTSQDHVIMGIVAELFDQLYQRRMRIRLIGVKFSSLLTGHYQINLFEDSCEIISLYQAMDHLRTKHGNYAIQRAAGFKPRINALAPSALSLSKKGPSVKK